VIALIFGFGLVSSCGGDPAQPPKISPQLLSGEAKPYAVISENDNSFSGRKRLIFGIFSTADTANSMALTVVQAARDLQKSTSADLVEICLYPSEKLAAIGDNYTAKALYAPDGGGSSGTQGWKWDVCAASQPYTQQEIKIGEEWWGNRKRFQLKNGGTDEPALKKFLSEKLGLPLNEIELPDHFCDTTINVR